MRDVMSGTEGKAQSDWERDGASAGSKANHLPLLAQSGHDISLSHRYSSSMSIGIMRV